eukprot:SAG31_NODE_45703_length_257_cov_2.677215_1_plen_50_part_00
MINSEKELVGLLQIQTIMVFGTCVNTSGSDVRNRYLLYLVYVLAQRAEM